MRIGMHRITQGLLGLILIGFSMTPLFGWEPPPVATGAELMRDAIVGSGYILPLILIVYLVVGVSWLVNRFVPLSALILFPICVNILLFHTILNREPFGVIAAALLFLANVYILVRNLPSYATLMRAKVAR